MRGHFVYHIKGNIKKLYELPGDPTAIARRVEYLLEDDRFMCPPYGYEVRIHGLINLDFGSLLTVNWA